MLRITALFMAVTFAFAGLPYVGVPLFDIAASATYMYMDDAKSVKIGEIVKGSLGGTSYMRLSDATDYYKVEISQPGEVSITKGGKKYRASNVEISVFDPSGGSVTVYAEDGNNGQIATGTFDAPKAGTYYLEVSGNSTDYIFTVSTKTGKFIFADDAKPLGIGNLAQGHLEGAGSIFAYTDSSNATEANYYKMQFEHKGTLIITGGTKGKISIYNSLNKLIPDLKSDTTDNLRTTSKELSKGTYYIAVTGENVDYMFTTRFEYDGKIIGKYVFAKDAKPLAFGKPTNAQLPDNGLIEGYAAAAFFIFGMYANTGGAAPATDQYLLDVPSAGEIKISIGGDLAHSSTSLVCYDKFGRLVEKSGSKSLTIKTKGVTKLYVAITGTGTAKYKILADFTAVK